MAPAPAPAIVERQLAKLSQATVEGIAAQHRKDLAKCEAVAELHGEVNVRFEVDATGKVTKSQVASTLRNPKVTGCILKALRGWQFPRSPSGAAEGNYAMSYQ